MPRGEEYYYRGEIEFTDYELGDITVEVDAEAWGWYTPGDNWGMGEEPPDGEFEITSLECKNARDKDGNPVVITEKLEDEILDYLYDNADNFS